MSAVATPGAKPKTRGGTKGRTGTTRIRRKPEVAEAEILDAAEQMLRERPFRDFAVDELMRRTGLSRTAFYVYFKDRNGVILRLIERTEEEMFDVANQWLNATRKDPVADVRAALQGVARVYAKHGPVLAAIAEASHHDDAVEKAYRGGLIEDFIQAVAKTIREEKRAGRVDVPSPVETARALLLLNERYFTESLGRESRISTSKVVETLQTIWVRTIYGELPPQLSGNGGRKRQRRR